MHKYVWCIRNKIQRLGKESPYLSLLSDCLSSTIFDGTIQVQKGTFRSSIWTVILSNSKAIAVKVSMSQHFFLSQQCFLPVCFSAKKAGHDYVDIEWVVNPHSNADEMEKNLTKQSVCVCMCVCICVITDMSCSMTKQIKCFVLPMTQISLGFHRVWSESLLSAQWVAKDPRFLHADSKLLSDWAGAQADLSLCWAHRSFCWFCHVQAHIIILMSPFLSYCRWIPPHKILKQALYEHQKETFYMWYLVLCFWKLLFSHF